MKNLQLNNLKNIEAFAMDSKYLPKLNLKSPLYVITDPPRTGMDPKTILALKQLKPKLIIYISCNPQQLSKDLFKLREYKVVSSALFDLFPQTPHSEAVVELIPV
jgi:23S rRNA (uracil1939-C5)-methyltransferase